MRKLTIIVGTGTGTQDDIVKRLGDQGYDALKVLSKWPRDRFMHIDGQYFSGLKSSLGEGGCIRKGDGFVLISDNVNEVLSANALRRIEPREYDQKVVVPINDLGSKIPTSRLHVFPTGHYHGGGSIHAHIDMHTLVIPSRKTLFVDTWDKTERRYNRSLQNIDVVKRIEQICDVEGLNFELYDGSQDGCWWPLNAAVFPKIDGQGEVVLVDERATNLQTTLECMGIECIAVPGSKGARPNGNLNCATNYLFAEDFTSIEAYLESVLMITQNSWDKNYSFERFLSR